MSHIYKLRHNDHKNAINARNKTVKAGQDGDRKTLYSQESHAVKAPTQYFIDIGLITLVTTLPVNSDVGYADIEP